MNVSFRFSCDSYWNLVGTSGLEPPTSRLSGARSNHLSYAPLWLTQCISFFSRLFNGVLTVWWRWWDSNPWPPACRAGALPAELHPHRVSRSLKIEQQLIHTTLYAPTSRLSSFAYLRNMICPWKHIRFSIERRWSSRTFRYGYLVTT